MRKLLLIPEIILIIFIILKLIGIIHWNWLWVVSPVWISFGLIIIIGIEQTIENWLEDKKDGYK